jgi:hypothetical protein
MRQLFAAAVIALSLAGVFAAAAVAGIFAAGAAQAVRHHESGYHGSHSSAISSTPSGGGQERPCL